MARTATARPTRPTATSRAAARRAPRQDEAPAHAFIVIDGRRWRASDPHIPGNLRQELVNELMAARRGVRDASTDGEVRASRRRVNDAKLALGERGHAWWLPPPPGATAQRMAAAMRALLRSRQPDRTICPSDVARAVGGPAWRALLPAVRECAVEMRGRGELEILRRGEVVTGHATKGVLRYRPSGHPVPARDARPPARARSTRHSRSRSSG